jgi:hypothetical protein
MLHRTVLLECRDHACHLRALLADGDIDADQVFALLVDDRVQRESRFAGLPVADDQLALAAPDREHRVNGPDTRLHRAVDIPALDYAGRNAFDRHVAAGADRPLAVNRLAEHVHHTPDQRVTNRNGNDAPGAAHFVTLFDFDVIAHDDHTDIILLQVERDAHHAVFELDQFLGTHAVQPDDAGDAVAHLIHITHIYRFKLALKAFDLL